MNHFRTILTAGAFTLLAGAASAASYFTAGTCDISDVMNGGSATECYGVVEQEGAGGINDSEDMLNTGEFFDVSLSTWMSSGGSSEIGLFGGGWTFGDRVNGTGTSGDLTVGDGTFSWAGDVYDEMLVILKQASSFTAYLFDGGVSGDGTWSTVGAFGSDSNDLSHLTVYYRGGMSEVPVPAAGLLLLGGLGGLAALRRRKS